MAAAAVAVAGVLGASQAHAGWQFTQWGMSPAQVVQASGARAVKGDDPDPHWSLKIRGPYRVGDVTFKEVALRFDDDRLTLVTLRADGDSFEGIERALATAVGKPTYSSNLATRRRLYIDRLKGNSIDLMGFDGGTFLTYGPITNDF